MGLGCPFGLLCIRNNIKYLMYQIWNKFKAILLLSDSTNGYRLFDTCFHIYEILWNHLIFGPFWVKADGFHMMIKNRL